MTPGYIVNITIFVTYYEFKFWAFLNEENVSCTHKIGRYKWKVGFTWIEYIVNFFCMSLIPKISSQNK